jgi:transcriptional regulator with XRE-family HTH domain
MDYGKSFKFYRQRAKLTQKEAADLMGINPYQLGNYETNRSEPSLTILKKMSKAYLVSIDKLLGNNLLQNKLEKEHSESAQEYVDINEVLKKLNEYVDQQNKK